ncbi:hypothetical protein [Massilia sp. TWP1-3-3]|uniref:hypothetical protein n=1 Tax=Massilia sp. TWP1-3-3 TaxID=2804573 RepID=UPI003CF1318D
MTGQTRRRYVIASLLAHACLLAAVFYVGPYSIKAATLDRHVKNAQESDIKRRVDEIEKIKTLLEKSRQEGAAPKDGTGGTTKAGSPATLPQLLERARRVSAEIEKMERRDKARELARLLNITEAQARAKLPPPAPVAVPKSEAKLSGAQKALAELRRHQQLARNALVRREQQLAKARDGTRVRPENGASGQGAAGAPSALAGLGDGGTGKAGKGGAGKNGLQGEDVPNAAHIEITSYIAQSGMAQARVPRGGSWDLSTPKHKVDRGYGAAVSIPGIQTVGLRQISTHAIGQGAPYADRIFLNRWHIIGPFPGRGPHDSIDVVYPPEMMVDLDAEYLGIGGSTLRWEYLTNPDYPSVAPVRAQDAVYYAYTEVVMDEERDLVLALGSDDDTKLWFNDRLVWLSGDGYKPWYSSPGYVGLSKEIKDWNLTEGTRRVRFKKGRNSLLLKLYNGASLSFFSVVVVADTN